MKLGLRTKYALSISLLIISVVLILSSVLLWHFRHALGDTAEAGVRALNELGEAQLRNHGLEFAHMVAASVADPLSAGRLELVHEILRDARRHHSVEYLLLFDSEGRIVLDGLRRQSPDFGRPVTDPFALEVLRDGQPRIRERQGIMDMVVPVTVNGIRGGLWLGFSEAMLSERLASMGAKLAFLRHSTVNEGLIGISLLTLALLLAGVLLALQLATRLTHPIMQLAASVVRIGQAQPAVIDVNRDDEIGVLARALAAMQRDLERTTVSKALLGAIIDSLNEALLVTSPEGRIRMVNRTACEMFGFPERELLGAPFETLVVESGGCGKWLNRIREQGGGDRYQECLFRTRDGATVPVAVSQAFLREGEARDDVVFVIQNIAERQRMEEELRQYRENLEQLVADRTRELRAVNRELESFSYSVSHDLRTPLRALNGFSEAVIEDYGDRLDEEGRRYLERIRNASERMSAMIDGMLILSRVTRQEISCEPIDLSALSNELLDELRSTDPTRSVDAVIEPGLRVVGDPALLRLLLQNLLSNAWKFTADRDEARIEVGQIDRDGQIVCFVRDNGVGFPPEMEDRLFQPFGRLHGDDRFEGSGIGLATAARIVSRHGGRIWASGEPGRGATFYFSLPHPQQ